jgi:hypothetical protein
MLSPSRAHAAPGIHGPPDGTGATGAADDDDDDDGPLNPLAPPELRVFRGISGEDVVSLPFSLSAAQCRLRLAAILSADPYALRFVRKRPLTDRAFATAESCTVVVLGSYAVACFRCGRRVRCTCQRSRCRCPRSEHSCLDDTCESCLWGPRGG